MKPNLLDALAERPLLSDGAMGTQLMLAGLPAGACGLQWNVEAPQALEAIHKAYCEAGCDLATTNTFEGTRFALAKHGLGDRVEDFNREGVARARVVARDGWVLGDVGPIGDFLEPLGSITEDEALAMFAEQVRALADANADAIIVESMSDAGELALAVRAARATGLPVIATFAFSRGDGVTYRTMMGTDVATALQAAIDAGADGVGANCGASMGLDDYRRLAESVVANAGGHPTILQPNAGSPTLVDGQAVYGATPEDMAALAADLLQAGIRIVGGCCGTTPQHLAAMKRVMP